MQSIFFCAYEINEETDTTTYQIYRRQGSTSNTATYEAKLKPDDTLLMAVQVNTYDQISLTGEATKEEQLVLGDLYSVMRYEREDWSDFIFEYAT